MLRRFPGIRIEPREVVVNGWPWNTVIATHLLISAPLPDGRQYRNEGMQLLRLRWGRVVEDLIFEDTLKLDAELQRMRQRAAEPVDRRDEHAGTGSCGGSVTGAGSRRRAGASAHRSIGCSTAPRAAGSTSTAGAAPLILLTTTGRRPGSAAPPR